MTATIAWSISQLERETADGFVFTAHYRIDAKDAAYTAGAYGSIGFERPRSLIPYSSLNEELVIRWVKEALTAEKVADIEAALQQQINEQRTPTKSAGVPWAS